MQNAFVRADERGQEENHCLAQDRVKAELRLKVCGAAARGVRACALLLLLSLHGCHTQEGELKNNEPAATPLVCSSACTALVPFTVARP